MHQQRPPLPRQMTGDDPSQLSASGELVPAGPASGGQDDARRERKRATDRKSQRDHRERQKAYIRQLEDTVKTLRTDCTADERVATLLAEQEKLQKANTQLSSQLDRVRSIVGEKPAASSSFTIHDDVKPSSISPPSTALVPASSAVAIKSGSPDSLASSHTVTAFKIETPGSSPAAAHGAHAYGGLPGQMALSDPLLQTADLQPHQMGMDISASAVNSGLVPGSGLIPGPGMVSANSVITPTAGIGIAASMPPDSIPPAPAMHSAMPQHASLHGLPPHNQAGMPQSIPQSMSCPVPAYLCMPQLCPPVGMGDSHLMSMLEEARSDCRNGRMSVNGAEPSLRQLLADKPYDTLSYRLYHYLRSYGGMPLHIFLAIFWTQYVLLRWLTVQTEAAYLKVPEWLRPLPIQCHVPHRIIVCVLIWPDVRDMLVRDASLNPEMISIDLLMNLNPNWNPSYMNGGSLLDSLNLDIVQMVEKESCSIDFWNVGPGFAKKYPEYAHLRIG